MRCTTCLSYLPTGTDNPTACPNCGAKTTEHVSSLKLTEETGVKKETPSSSEISFAPYFTVRSKLSFTLKGSKPKVSLGSISFGPEGFSVVSEEGKYFEKIYYRDLLEYNPEKNGILISSHNRSKHAPLEKDTERLLVLYHPWLPAFLGGIQKKRAGLFCELLSVIKNGLTPDQVEHFRQSLNSN